MPEHLDLRDLGHGLLSHAIFTDYLSLMHAQQEQEDRERPSARRRQPRARVSRCKRRVHRTTFQQKN